jgi:hypothetical protein
MKKTYFVAAAVALAVLIAGCEGFIEPPAKADNSEGLVISFRTGDGSVTSDGSRALTTPIAAAGSDFFEVVFDNGAKKVRTSWGGGRTGKIIPGAGIYDNAFIGDNGVTNGPIHGKAYLFAGRNGTLLGVGLLVDVINNVEISPGDYSSGTTIDMDTAIEVVFEVTALNTDVGGLRNPAGTPFSTPKPDGSNPKLTTFQFPAAGAAYTGLNVGSLLLDETQDPPLTAPVFIVDPSTVTDPGDPDNLPDPIPPTYSTEPATFDITDTTGDPLSAVIQSAIIAAASTPTGPPPLPTDRNRIISNGFIWEAGGSPLGEVTGVVDQLIKGDQLPIPIPLTLTPGPKVGLSRISIEIPVFLYSDDSDITASALGDPGWENRPTTNGAKPVTWYIRGGLNNTAVDQGATFSDHDGSMGGAILIGVGDYNKNAAGLIISIRSYK